LALVGCGRPISIRSRGLSRSAICPSGRRLGVVCKTVGIAYVGSNPTPATSKIKSCWLGLLPLILVLDNGVSLVLRWGAVYNTVAVGSAGQSRSR
jgi:hypothetical protein